MQKSEKKHAQREQKEHMHVNAKRTTGSNEIKKAIAAREGLLYPLYHQVASKFAELHDTPGRMYAKGVINDIVPLSKARTYFYWKLRRRLCEKSFIDKVKKIQPEETWQNSKRMLYSMMTRKPLEDDCLFVKWFRENKSQIENKLEKLQPGENWQDSKSLESVIQRLAQSKKGVVGGLADVIAALPVNQKEALSNLIFNAQKSRTSLSASTSTSLSTSSSSLTSSLSSSSSPLPPPSSSSSSSSLS